MVNRFWAFLSLCLLIGMTLLATQPASAGSRAQVVYETPTAQPDGRVVYIVQEGDSCLRIELLTGVKVKDLIALNRLDEACTIIPGKEILLAVITPQPSPTLNPDVTNTPLLPTPTPYKGNGSVCVVLYNDINGNATHEENESPIAGGAVSITDRLGQVSKTASTTDSADPVCEEIPEGTYTISMAIPSGYNATTTLNLQNVKVQAGDLAILEFGAQVSSAPQAAAPGEPQQAPRAGSGLLMAIIGGLLIVMGIGLGIYIAFARHQ